MCPQQALKYAAFAERPKRREDVMDITAGKGDDSRLICLEVCPR